MTKIYTTLGRKFNQKDLEEAQRMGSDIVSIISYDIVSVISSDIIIILCSDIVIILCSDIVRIGFVNPDDMLFLGMDLCFWIWTWLNTFNNIWQ